MNNYDQFLERNRSLIDSYVSKIQEVKIDDHLVVTFDEWRKFDNSLEETPVALAPSENFIDAAGFRPFYMYSTLMMECLGNIARNEKRRDLIPKENEKPYHWLKRIEELKDKDFDLWNQLFADLAVTFIDIHNGKRSKV